MNFIPIPLTADEERQLYNLLSISYRIPEERIRYHNNGALPPIAEEIGGLLYRKFYDWMLKKATGYTGVQQVPDAEDLVADTVVRFFERGSWQGYSANNGATVEAWFATVYVNGLTDSYRKWLRLRKENEISLDQEMNVF